MAVDLDGLKLAVEAARRASAVLNVIRYVHVISAACLSGQFAAWRSAIPTQPLKLLVSRADSVLCKPVDHLARETAIVGEHGSHVLSLGWLGTDTRCGGQ